LLPLYIHHWWLWEDKESDDSSNMADTIFIAILSPPNA